MNKLLTYAGTMPVYLGDLDFMQNAAKGSIGQLAQALMGSGNASQNAILQGLVFSISSGEISFTSGIVVLGGEVLPIDAGVVTASAVSELYLHVDSELSGTRTFKDGQSHDCYDTRSAIINTTSAGGVAVSSLKRLQIPSYKDYNYTSVSGCISDGKLVYKGGVWFVSASLVVESGFSENTIGTITFSVDQEGLSYLPGSVNFPVLIMLFSNEVQHIIPVVATISTSGSSATFQLYTYTALTDYGIGACRTIIPVF